MSEKIFALKGTVCYSKSPQELVFMENAHVVCENGTLCRYFPCASGKIQ